MPEIIQLSPHIANLIAAGEVVERPASVVKELLENAVDAGASKVTVEIREGGMTFIRVTDNGCGMSPKNARTAFLRHATSKLRTAEDLAAISTMGFRGEALAAIASVSRIDLMTKTPGAIEGVSLLLEAGQIMEESEVGCPEGTTIIVRDLFFNTPARMKFMKSDSVEGSKVALTVQMQALAHPEVAFRFLRDGKEILNTPGSGKLEAAVYSVYGKEFGKMVQVDSRWEGYSLTGFISKPTDHRNSRSMQTFFVNGRPVKSRILIAALEEAYRNQIMIGKFPACVLHVNLPAHMVDVNVHPAKTEVKFLNEKAVFDCVHYGVLGALNKTADRPEVRFNQPRQEQPAATTTVTHRPNPEQTFRTMDTQQFRAMTQVIKEGPKPQAETARQTYKAVDTLPLHSPVEKPKTPPLFKSEPESAPPSVAHLPSYEQIPVKPTPAPQPVITVEEEPEQTAFTIPDAPQWRLVGELYKSYIIVEQGEEAFLIDKHAAHERILFEKLKANQEAISSQALLAPVPCRLRADAAAELLSNKALLEELGFEVDEFGTGTILVRQIPMDLDESQIQETLESIAQDLANGRRESAQTVRDEILHTVACKAAIKAGWKTDELELKVLVDQVMGDENLKYCPHGRPICITLSKKMLEKQFKRT